MLSCGIGGWWLLLLELLPSWSLLLLLLVWGDDDLLDGDGDLDLLSDDLLSGDLLGNGDLKSEDLLSRFLEASGLKHLSFSLLAGSTCCLVWSEANPGNSSLPTEIDAFPCFLWCCWWTSWWISS